MKRFKQFNEDGSFKLVDMDDKSYQTALKLAKKAKLNPFTKKTRTGMEIEVFGDNKAIMKFLKSLPESTQNWAKSLELLKRKRLTSSDKKKLDAIRDLLNKEK